MSHVRFPLISPRVLAETVETHGLMKTEVRQLWAPTVFLLHELPVLRFSTVHDVFFPRCGGCISYTTPTPSLDLCYGLPRHAVGMSSKPTASRR